MNPGIIVAFGRDTTPARRRNRVLTSRHCDNAGCPPLRQFPAQRLAALSVDNAALEYLLTYMSLPPFLLHTGLSLLYVPVAFVQNKQYSSVYPDKIQSK